MRFAIQKAEILSDLCATLLTIFDAVICGDVDELIVIDPTLNQDLIGYIETLPKDKVVAPVGFNVMPQSDYYERPYPRVDLDRPLLGQCNRLSLASNFSKPSILKTRARFAAGQHWLDAGDFVLDPNLALFHLKYLALNNDDYYRNLAEEVAEFSEKTGKPVRHKLWIRGRAGLSQMAGKYDKHTGDRLSSPREEARQLHFGPVSENNPKVRLLGPKRGEIFRLDESWLGLV